MGTQEGILYGSDRFLRMLYRFFYSLTDSAVVYGLLYGFSLRTWNTVYSLCILTIALGVVSALTDDYSLALSLYADLLIVLTIVHFDGTSILSLHTMYRHMC
jgi:hypothetical protein